MQKNELTNIALTQSQIIQMRMAIGFDYSKVIKGVFQPNKNKYATKRKSSEWDKLVSQKLAIGENPKVIDPDEWVYMITYKGLDYLSGILGVHINKN